MADLSAHMGELQMGDGSEMVGVDEYDPLDEKQDVAIITPDGSTDELPPEPRADDCILTLPRLV